MIRGRDKMNDVNLDIWDEGIWMFRNYILKDKNIILELSSEPKRYRLSISLNSLMKEVDFDDLLGRKISILRTPLGYAIKRVTSSRLMEASK